jgi:endonuclease/exonuclease/phosphatase family metal-dependent hydrolase
VLTLGTPGGAALRVVNTHLTHRYSSPVQLALLVHRLGGSSLPTVLAGDLNMPRPATLVARGYRSVVRGRSFPAGRPLVQLDHMLLSGAVSATEPEVLEPVGSDHRPIRARLSPG